MIKDIIRDLQRLDTHRDTLRKFSFVISISLFLIAAVLFIKGNNLFVVLFLIGAIVLAIGQIKTMVLKYVYLGWMAIAITVGWVISRIFITVIFYFIITPWGIVLRLFRKDLLDQKINTSAVTYWKEKHHVARKQSAGWRMENYKKMF